MKKYFLNFFNAFYTPKGNKKNYVSNYILKNQNDDTPYPANLPPESELDRLRESIPIQASKALFGEKDMSKAWRILESLYGDKDLIANKLKSQIKNIKV